MNIDHSLIELEWIRKIHRTSVAAAFMMLPQSMMIILNGFYEFRADCFIKSSQQYIEIGWNKYETKLANGLVIRSIVRFEKFYGETINDLSFHCTWESIWKVGL